MSLQSGVTPAELQLLLFCARYPKASVEDIQLWLGWDPRFTLRRMRHRALLRRAKQQWVVLVTLSAEVEESHDLPDNPVPHHGRTG